MGRMLAQASLKQRIDKALCMKIDEDPLED